MPVWLNNSLPGGSPESLLALATRLWLAFLLGWMVAFIYRRLPRAEPYPPTFPPTLVLLTILIGVVTHVVGDNVARAFSLVGALSIVRFRTVVQDTQDTAFVIFAVIVGMAVGANHIWSAVICLITVGIAAWVVQPRSLVPPKLDPLQNDFRLTVRLLNHSTTKELETLLERMTSEREMLSAMTESKKDIVEIRYRVRFDETQMPLTLVESLDLAPNVQSVEIKRA